MNILSHFRGLHAKWAGRGSPGCRAGRGLARSIRLLCCLLCGLAGLGGGAAAELAIAKEYQLKAAFLYNFTKFVDWPTSSFAGSNAPFVLGVVGRSPCTAELEQIVKDRKVNGRQIVVRIVATTEAAKSVHALFLPAGEDPRLEEWLGAVRGLGVLTVGESELFVKHGGVIHFLLEGEKIRFDINMDQADAGGLKVSAQLQKLAKSVRRKP